MKIFRVSHREYGKSGLFQAEDEMKAKQSFLEHFGIPWTYETWSKVMAAIDVEARPVNEHGFIDLSVDYGPDGEFTNSVFRNNVDE